MTVMTWVMDGLLAAMAAAMLIKGKYGITRQLAAGAAGAGRCWDAAFCGADPADADAGAFPGCCWVWS